jgi:hypothetical protein
MECTYLPTAIKREFARIGEEQELEMETESNVLFLFGKSKVKTRRPVIQLLILKMDLILKNE